MQSFKGHTLNEAFPSGANWEMIICCAYNMKSKGVPKDEAIKLAGIEKWNPRFDPFIPQAEGIVDGSFSNPTGVMEHYGMGSASLTKGWDDYFVQTTGKSAAAATKTPKTDMYIGNQQISLKKFGASQLMSGGKAETLATLAFAYDNTPARIKTAEMDKAWKKMAKVIERDYMKTKLPAGTTVGGFKKRIKAGKTDTFTTLIKDTLAKNDAMTDALNSLLTGDEIRQEVCREAMTGLDKFSDKLPKASHMMVFNPKGSSHYKAINDSVVKDYASKTTFNISFKTAGTGKGAWTALKAIYSEDVDTSLEQIISESIDEADQQMLTEGIFGKAVAVVKKWVMLVMRKIWNKIKQLFNKGLGYGLQILGLTMDVNNPTVKY